MQGLFKIGKKVNLKKRVMKLLERYPILRDDTSRTIVNIWADDLKKIDINIEQITGLEILKMVAQNKLTNSWTIRRYWQKVQEENVLLRGNRFAHRHTVKQKEHRAQLGYKV